MDEAAEAIGTLNQDSGMTITDCTGRDGHKVSSQQDKARFVCGHGGARFIAIERRSGL